MGRSGRNVHPDNHLFYANRNRTNFIGMEIWIPVVVTVLGAGFTSYVGVRIAIAEMKGKIQNNKEAIDRHEKELDWLRDRIIK